MGFTGVARRPRTAVYNDLITALGRQGNMPVVMHILEEMRRLGQGGNRVTYFAAMECAERTRDDEAALALLRAFRSRVRAGRRRRRARQCYRQGKRSVVGEKWLLPPRECEQAHEDKCLEEMYRGAMSACVGARNFDCVRSLLAELEGLLAEGRDSASESTEGQKSGEIFPGPVRAKTLMVVVAGHCESGNWLEAARIVSGLESAAAARAVTEEASSLSSSSAHWKGNFRTDCPIDYDEKLFLELMDAFRRAHTVAGIPWLIRQMYEKGLRPSLEMYNAALSVCARCGDWPMAYDLLGQMQFDSTFNHVAPDQTTFDLSLSVCAHSGEGQAALKVLQDIERAGYLPSEKKLRGCNFSRRRPQSWDWEVL